MTLVFSVAGPYYGLQVTDRLLTTDGTPFDHEANKSVVYLGSDGLLAFSYTGPAYIGGMPTDNRIASALTDGAALGMRATQLNPAIRNTDLGSALRKVRDELDRFAAFARGGGEVSAVGWQWGAEKRQLRPVLWELARGESGGLSVRSMIPRQPFTRLGSTLGGKVFVAAIGAHEGVEIDVLVEKVRDAGENVDRAEEVLVDEVRRAAATTHSPVGPNCLSVQMARAGQVDVCNPKVKFVPMDPHVAVSGPGSFEVGFSPWIVAPGVAAAPARVVGSSSIGSPAGTVEIEGPTPAPGQGLLAAYNSQLRPGSPGWQPTPFSEPLPGEEAAPGLSQPGEPAGRPVSWAPPPNPGNED